MKKTKTFFFSLFLILFLILTLNSVKADTYGDIADAYQDSFTQSVDADSNFDGFAYMWSGLTGANGYMRVFININTTDIITQDIEYAYLKVYGHVSNAGDENFTVRIYEVNESWDETTLTHNNQPEQTQINTLDLDYDGGIEDIFWYLDITDSWDEFYGLSFTDFYGYSIYLVNNGGSEYFYLYTIDSSFYSTVYYSNIELDIYGNPLSESGTSEPLLSDTLILDFVLYGVFFLVIPLTIVVSVSNLGDKISGSLLISTFVGSETLMGAIALNIGIIDIWFMFAIIVLDVILILAMIRSSNY